MPDQVVETHAEKPLLTESKFYTLARTMPLLDALVPDLPTQMQTEVQIDDIFPREEADNDDTRILINYTNIKGNPSLYKINDSERLTRRFDLDEFMNGFTTALNTGSETDTQAQIVTSIMSALNMSVNTILGTAESVKNKKVSDLSYIILHSIIAVLYNDALDVIIVIEERPGKEKGDPTVSIIVGMWIVKQRTIDGVDDPDTIHAQTVAGQLSDETTDEDRLASDTIDGLKSLPDK